MSGRERSAERGKRFLRMDRNYPPIKINDPSLPTGRRKEIDNVMKKARNNPNDYWDKKLLEVEERDPNRWRHTGYKKLYVEGENENRSRSRSRSRSPSRGRRVSPPPLRNYRGSPVRDPRQRSPPPKRPKSPQENYMRRKPIPPSPRRKPQSPPPKPRPGYRPPSPPHSKRSPSVSSSSSSSSGSYVRRSRSRSPVPPKRNIRSPPVHPKPARYAEPGGSKMPPAGRYARSPSPPYEEFRKGPEKRYAEKAPVEKPVRTHKVRAVEPSHKRISPKPRVTSTSDEYPAKAKPRPQEPVEPPPKPKKTKRVKEKHVPVRIKIEDEPKRRARSTSTESNCSSNSEVCVFSALNSSTRITLSERFGKIAQWSTDRTNMENMRITKNSAGGDLKVLIEEGIESPTDPGGYSPVRPDGHFPDELLTEGPTGLLSGSWDDVRVRYQYYKDRGYLRGLDLQDYIKWEEWWYRYQEWLRNCEMWERSQMTRRHRKKLPITARLN